MEYIKQDDTYIVRLERGEEILRSLRSLCSKEDIKAGMINGIGASDHAVIGLFDVNEKVYHQHEFNEPMEITSITGNISAMDDEPYLHIHVNLGREDMSVIGGHLNECVISATCELFIYSINRKIGRTKDPETGLNLYEF